MTNNFLKNKEKHQFHLVDNSQLSLVTSTAAMLLVMSFVFYFYQTQIFQIKKKKFATGQEIGHVVSIGDGVTGNKFH